MGRMLAHVSPSRPLGFMERFFFDARGSRGHSDPYFIATLDSIDAPTLTDSQVTLAWALLRVRHPLLTARVSDGPEPVLVCTPPLTETHAMKEARSQVEFDISENIGEAALKLQDRWVGVDARNTLDVRREVCTVFWCRGVGASAGKYVFGLNAIHSVTDGRSMLNLTWQFLEALAAPERARYELARHFDGQVSSIKVPVAIESISADRTATCGADEQKAFGEAMKFAAMPMSGLVPDGTDNDDKIQSRVVRHVWSKLNTSRVVRACRAHGVTVTQLVSAAMVIAALPSTDNSLAVPNASQRDGSKYFHILNMIDLSSRWRRLPKGDGINEAVLGISAYPTLLRIPAAYEQAAQVVWDIAKQSKEHRIAYVESPYFQHFNRSYQSMLQSYVALCAGGPCLPAFSSVGDCSKLLPSRYGIHPTTNGIVAPPGSPDNGLGGEIVVTDIVIGLKAFNALPTLHVWTFNNELSMLLTHNSSHSSTSLIDPYFQRIVNIVTLLAAEEVEPQV
ncbi:hypothetical protein AcW1_002228 [Taiwanofungus camphoratus]|nr:hypothetical protein AcV5_010222 [Antrodia cinnamomea]KAI0944547.1 hypothetical protein AcW1_002228 [Antrodia cinnamomea]